MGKNKDTSFDTLVETFLGTGFPRHLSGTVSLSELSPDTRDFIIRLLDLMKRSRYSITGFNSALIRWLSSTIPGILPSAWGGRIPPITMPGRHRRLDDYVAGQNFAREKHQHIFVDIGCGFPPVTTADTACRFPDWQVYGVDRSFADYIVYDTRGHYACFNRAGEFLYFQAFPDLAGRALYADPRRTRHKFNQLFKGLFPLLSDNDTRASQTVKKDGNKLIHNHITDYETNNLGFINSDMTDLSPLSATVIRCMNVFMYLPADMKKKRLERIKDHLENNGLLIIGTNGLGIQSRYAVYKKHGADLILDEFAFSLDNLGHISFMPWFTIHDNDREAILLARLSAAIRSHPSFWTQFCKHLDVLLEYYGLCKRKTDGFLHFAEQDMLPGDFLEKNALLWRKVQKKGYVQGAVDVLGKDGYDAWINSAGDIAVRPPNGALS